VDESGFDQHESPYQVLAGVAIRDDRLWPLICAMQDAEVAFFGRRVTKGELELKGKKLLKSKVYRLAAQMATIPPEERTRLARSCLDKGVAAKGQEEAAGVTRAELTALAQAKIAFVGAGLDLFDKFDVRAFASIVPKDAPCPERGTFLRKDYSYMFERYFNFLDRGHARERGLVVFDELEKSQCHLLVEQMALYFKETATGKMRAERIIPEPFFVHSDLTTAIQLADLVAYIIAWGLRLPWMTAPRREELAPLADKVRRLQHVTYQVRRGQRRPVNSFTVIEDLRARCQR
jgi:hypothetical protein